MASNLQQNMRRWYMWGLQASGDDLDPLGWSEGGNGHTEGLVAPGYNLDIIWLVLGRDEPVSHEERDEHERAVVGYLTGPDRVNHLGGCH